MLYDFTKLQTKTVCSYDFDIWELVTLCLDCIMMRKGPPRSQLPNAHYYSGQLHLNSLPSQVLILDSSHQAHNTF